MTVQKLLAIVVIVSGLVQGTAYAQSAPVFTSTVPTSSLRDAIARQHQPLRSAQAPARRSGGRSSSVATKATAGFALGVVGVFAGMLAAFGFANAVHAPGDGRGYMYTGAIAGGGAGAALGVWLASR